MLQIRIAICQGLSGLKLGSDFLRGEANIAEITVCSAVTIGIALLLLQRLNKQGFPRAKVEREWMIVDTVSQLWHLKPKTAISATSAISLSYGATEGFLRQLWIRCKHCNAWSALAPVLGTGFTVRREREGAYSATPYQLWHLKLKTAISAISLSCGANEGFLRQLWIWCKHCNAKSPVLGTGFLVRREKKRGSIQCNAWSALAPVLGLT